jgi:hypothetical protein
LGVGQIRCGYIIDGERILCHKFTWNNVITTVAGTYMTSLSLPLRYYIEADGTTTSTFQLACICGAVKSEGGHDNIGRDHTILRSTGAPLTVTAAGVWVPVLGIRQDTSAQKKYVVIRPQEAEIAVMAGNSAVDWGLFRNPTVAGTSPTYLTWPDDNAIEYFVNTTTLTTITGTPFRAGVVTSTNQVRGLGNLSVNPTNQLGLSAEGVPDTLMLAVRSVGTTSGVAGSLHLRVAR